jgi:hypothetical protein
MIEAKDALVMIINYDRNHSFIVQATVITILNYNRKTFIVQATGLIFACKARTHPRQKPFRFSTLG